MFPNLLGQKAYHKMSANDMAGIINVSLPTFQRKMRSGKFTITECVKYAEYFGKPIEYLFAIEKPDKK